jgi:hypothetical protein
VERAGNAADNRLIADYFDYTDCAEEALVVTVRKLKGKRKEFLFVLFVGKDLPQKRQKKRGSHDPRFIFPVFILSEFDADREVVDLL